MSEAKKREGKERDLPAGAKVPQRRRSDHPLKQFAHSMKDFRGGISALKRVAEKLASRERPKKGTLSGGKFGPTVRERGVSQGKFGPTVRGREVSSEIRRKMSPATGTSEPRNVPIRMAAPNVHAWSRGRARNPQKFDASRHYSGHAMPWQEGVKTRSDEITPKTHEDREAFSHIHSLKEVTSPLAQLPRAARVAMILRADEIIKEGGGRESRLIESLAGAIRSGRPDVAANVSPKRVEQALARSLGGRQQALQAVWTPEVSRMVNRYHAERDRLVERIERVERGIPEGSHGSPVTRSGSASRSAPARDIPEMASAPVHASYETSAPRRNPPVESFFRRNDMSHLASQAERRRDLSVRSERRIPGATDAPRSERALPTQGTTPRRGQPTVKVAESGTQGSTGKRQLEGKLTIFSGNGEEVGTAQLTGSESGG